MWFVQNNKLVRRMVALSPPFVFLFFVYVFIALASAEGALVHKNPSMDNSGLANQRIQIRAFQENCATLCDKTHLHD